MAKAVRRYAPEYGQPGGYGHILGGLLSGTPAAAPLAPCVRDERSVRSPWPGSVTCLTSPGVLVADKTDKPSACRWRERLFRYGRWPRRHWPTGEKTGLRHENRNRRPLTVSLPRQIPAVSGGPEEPLAVIGSAEVPSSGAKKDILGARAPRPLGVPAGAAQAVRAGEQMRGEQPRQERRRSAGRIDPSLGRPL